jgi:tetratricopeptide (TPR) repeat protein
MRRVWVVLLLIVCVATAVGSARGLGRIVDHDRGDDELLYLPNGKFLKVASLGQAPVLADLIYIWAIQFYSNYDRDDRFRYVRHVFSNVIAELDPQYIDAYWLGALILIVENDDLEGGLALLDQGFAANPDKWILPYLAAWECWLAGQPERTAKYFEIAAAIPQAPTTVRRMRAAMVARSGDLETSLELWQEILDDPDSDATSVNIAERKIRDLTVRIDLRDLKAAIERFRIDNSRYPDSLAELQRGGYIRFIPRHPDGADYHYDPTTGQVSGPRGRILGDSG